MIQLEDIEIFLFKEDIEIFLFIFIFNLIINPLFPIQRGAFPRVRVPQGKNFRLLKAAHKSLELLALNSLKLLD